MNSKGKQKELLLILHTSFFEKAWVKNNNAEKDGWFSQREQLKEACWNGLTPEILPECFDNIYDRSTTLCDINEANTFIDLVYCNYTQKEEKQHSLNPYVFMEVQGFN